MYSLMYQYITYWYGTLIVALKMKTLHLFLTKVVFIIEVLILWPLFSDLLTYIAKAISFFNRY